MAKNKIKSNQTQVEREQVQSYMLGLIRLLDKRMDLENDVRDIDIKDITLMSNLLAKMGAFDDIIAKEHHEVMDVADKRFKLVFGKDIKEQKKELGL